MSAGIRVEVRRIVAGDDLSTYGIGYVLEE